MSAPWQPMAYSHFRGDFVSVVSYGVCAVSPKRLPKGLPTNHQKRVRRSLSWFSSRGGDACRNPQLDGQIHQDRVRLAALGSSPSAPTSKSWERGAQRAKRPRSAARAGNPGGRAEREPGPAPPGNGGGTAARGGGVGGERKCPSHRVPHQGTYRSPNGYLALASSWSVASSGTPSK